MSIRELTAYQVACDGCGGTAYDLGVVEVATRWAPWGPWRATLTALGETTP